MGREEEREKKGQAKEEDEKVSKKMLRKEGENE